MKRTIALVISAAFLMALGLSSCKTTSDCPAYSQNETPQLEAQA